MATATLTFPRLRTASRARAQARHRRIPFENWAIFVLAFSFYIAVASYLIFHLHYMNNDAYARTDNSFNVLFTRDPHLGAIGFAWPPLPSFLQLPIIAFKGWWPALVTQGFGGAIEASLFSAGTVVLFNSGLHWAGVVRGMRWIICGAWVMNPMIIIYAAQGMSEAEFIFFAVAAILVFLRWCESRRSALLPLAGLLAGAGCLCRNEMFFLTFVMGVAVIIRSIRWKVSWREVETKALLFGLPALLMIMLWIGSMAIILHNPLYWLNYHGAAAAAPAAAQASVSQAYGGIHVNTWAKALKFTLGHSLFLYPAVIGLLAFLVVRILVKRDRITGLLLLSLAIPIPLLDTYLLHSSGLAPVLRYEIFVIPLTFILAVYVLRSLKSKRALLSSWVSLVIAAILALSNIATGWAVGFDPLAPEEAPLVAAISTGRTVPEVSGQINAADVGVQLTPQIIALDTDHGRILCDSSTCFPIILNAPDPTMFTVTSDRDFEASAAQPDIYHVEYFLVPPPAGIGAFDRLNVLYPALWSDGAGFSSLVGSAGGFRLYRITGPTGRG